MSVRAWFGGALAALVLLAGCQAASSLEGRIAGLRDVLEQAERNGAYQCAPRELATAQAHLHFAEEELEQGDPSRAEEHVVVAEPNVQAAFRLSPAARCAPRDIVVERRPEPAPEPQPGDRDGDGLLEMVTVGRTGYMFAYDTDGPADGAITWPEWRHDNHNTGNFEAPLSNGGAKLVADAPIECPVPVRPDGGMPDEDAGAAGDAGVGGDAGEDGGVGGGGCDCRVQAGGDERMPLAFALASLVGLALVRRRR